MDGNRIIRLDGLRFIAALMVVFFHYAFRGAAAGVTPVLDLPVWLSGLSAYGYLGVNLFFMISGFVIAYSAEGRTPMDFAIARFARLYPSYIAAVTLTFLVTFLFGGPAFTTDIWHFLANLTMFAPAFGEPLMDGAYWSIVLEVIFYAWVFVFMLSGHFRKDCERIILLWLTLSLYNEFFFEIKPLRFFFLTEFAGFFAAGILIYRIRSNAAEVGTYALLLLSLAVSLVTTSNGLKVIEANYQMDYPDLFVSLLVVTLYALFYAASGDGPVRIPARYVAAAGAITYPLYLIHQHIGYIAISHLKGLVSDMALLGLVIVAMLGMAALVRVAIDKPIVPLLKRALTLRLGRLAQTVPFIGRYLTRRDVLGV
jgi:peptidoglycan/LPS O-acetylase OafA/YrhL